jgi:hypothetical protein
MASTAMTATILRKTHNESMRVGCSCNFTFSVNQSAHYDFKYVQVVSTLASITKLAIYTGLSADDTAHATSINCLAKSSLSGVPCAVLLQLALALSDAVVPVVVS